MRIRDKYLLTTLVGAAAVFAGYALFLAHRERSQEEASLGRRVEMINALLRRINEEPLWNVDRDLVQSNCESLFLQPDMVRLRLANPSRTIEIELDRSDPQRLRPDRVYAFPIVRGGHRLADVEVAYTTAHIEKRVARVRYSVLYLAAITASVIFIMYFILSPQLGRPFRMLIEAMKCVNRGDYTVSVDARRRDEFAEIARNFNTMVASIRAGNAKVQEYARELEQKTAQLEEQIAGRKRTEEALRQAQKMEAIARLAGGVAHDFNNLLTSILGFGGLARDALGEDHPVQADVEEILQAGERARELTQQLLALGRKKPMDLRRLDVNVVIRGLDGLLRRTLGSDIELITQFAERPETVMADAGSLEQALVNLAVNARDAMPDGGRLYLASAGVELTAEDAEGQPDARPGSFIVVSVRDTGTGMSAEVIEHLFEPFFTTKSEGKGTGLGLSTVYGIVKQFGGFIRVVSRLGEGSEFRLFLPAAAEEPETLAVELQDEPVGGSETILLVEDEASVRRFTARMLGVLGYRVLEARYGTEGLQVAAEYPGRIDLVLTDVVMPQLSGPEMVEQIGQVRNGFRVLFMSGFTQDQVGETDARGQPVRLMRKPFTRETLACMVREALDEA